MLLVIGSILCSCASTPPPEPVTFWEDYTPRVITISAPETVPAQPKHIKTNGLICYSPQNAKQLAARIEALKVNAKAGEGYAAIVQQYQQQVADLVAAGRMTETALNNQAQAAHKSTGELDRERGLRILESTLLQILLLGSFAL